MSPRTKLLVVSVLAAAILLWVPTTALAYYYYNGGRELGSAIGLHANDIETDNPFVGGGDAFSSAWIMLAQEGYEYRYMQIGYTEDEIGNYPESPWFFWEWASDYRGAVSFLQWDYADGAPLTADGSHNDYKISSDGTRYHFYINDVQRGEVGVWTTGWSPDEMFGMAETYYTTDQIPGTTSNHVTIGSLTYKTPGGSWVASNMSDWAPIGHAHPYGGSDIGGGDSLFTIWDTRY